MIRTAHPVRGPTDVQDIAIEVGRDAACRPAWYLLKMGVGAALSAVARFLNPSVRRDYDIYLPGHVTEWWVPQLLQDIQTESRTRYRRELRIHIGGIQTYQTYEGWGFLSLETRQALAQSRWLVIVISPITAFYLSELDAELDEWSQPRRDNILVVDPTHRLYWDEELTRYNIDFSFGHLLPDRLSYAYDLRPVAPPWAIARDGVREPDLVGTAQEIVKIVLDKPRRRLPFRPTPVWDTVRGYVRDTPWLSRGLFMSLGLVLAAAPAGSEEQGIEIAAIAAASVPVVGAALSAMFSHELRTIANTDLRRILLISQFTAVLAVVAFVASVVLGVSGLITESNVVYTALTSGTLGGVSLMIGQRAAKSRRYALTLEMVNSIEDPQLRDQVRARIALEGTGSPVLDPAPGNQHAPNGSTEQGEERIPLI
ncbi:hypothetical protein [Nocardia sp. NPDC005998]|uniref:hypothetical protein n=1 Tax=Nocardia sp. NPDC005998 TaxID=3156894 RepID=UPI0033A3C252